MPDSSSRWTANAVREMVGSEPVRTKALETVLADPERQDAFNGAVTRWLQNQAQRHGGITKKIQQLVLNFMILDSIAGIAIGTANLVNNVEKNGDTMSPPVKEALETETLSALALAVAAYAKGRSGRVKPGDGLAKVGKIITDEFLASEEGKLFMQKLVAEGMEAKGKGGRG